MGSSPIHSMFDSPRQECNAFSPFETLILGALLFSFLGVSDESSPILGLMMEELLGFLRSFQKTESFTFLPLAIFLFS